MSQITPFAALDAMLAAAERAAGGYDDLVLREVASRIVVQEAPVSVVEIRAARDRLREMYAADPAGLAARVLPAINGLFGVVREIVA